MKKHDAQYPPKRWGQQLRYFIIAFSLSVFAGLSTYSYAADDTELYASHQIEINPDLGSNILIILDKSGSMRASVPGDKSPISGGTTRMAHLTDAILLLLDELQGVNLGFATFSGSTRTSPQRSNVPIIFPISPIGAPINTVAGESSNDADAIEVLESAINNTNDDATQNIGTEEVLLDEPTIFMTNVAGSSIPSGDAAGTGGNDSQSFTGDETRIEYRIRNSKYDGQQYIKSRSQNLDYRIWLGRSSDNSKGVSIAAFRFQNLGIPKGSKITFAKLRFTADDDNQNDDLKLVIKAVDLDNPSDLTATGYAIKNLPTFPNTSLWDVTNKWEEDKKYNSDGFASVLQQVVNADYWDEDDAFIITVTGHDSLDRGDNRNIRKGDDGVTKIVVKYIEPDDTGSGSSDTKTTTTEISNADDHSKEFLNPNDKKGEIGSNDALWLGNQYFGNDRSGTLLGFRFENVQVPKNAVIKSAVLKINLDEESKSYTDSQIKVKIQGEDTVYAESYDHGSDNDYDLSNRAVKDTSVIWNVANGNEQETVVSPDLVDLIQQYVDDGAWRTNDNAISLLLRYNKSNGRRGVCGVKNSCYYSQKNHAPQLVIEWEGGEATPAADYRVGLRFQTVNIPQGATIEKAYLEFAASANNSSNASYTISAAKVGHEMAFSAEANNLGKRELLTTTVPWENVPAWKSGERYQSAELKTLMQSVVDQGSIGPNTDGWCGGRDLVFMIDAQQPDSLRKFVSHDSSPENAVKLHVEYATGSIDNDACVTRVKPFQINSGGNDGSEALIKADAVSNAIFLSDNPLEMSTTLNDKGKETVRLTGLRFTQLDLTTTTNVVKAELILTASHDDDEVTSWAVYGQKGHAPVFSDALKDFSSRPATNTKIKWEPSEWKRNQRYSLDVTDIVRENITGGWDTADSMAFFVEGTGLRRTYAFDNNPNNSALLKLTFTGRYQDNLPTARDRLKELVADHTRAAAIGGWTPLVPALYEGAQYYLGSSIYGGDYRGVDPGYSDYKGDRDNSVSHRGSFEGGLVHYPTGCTDADPYDYACREQVICTGENVKVKSGSYDPHKVCNGKSFQRPARYKQPPLSVCTGNHMVLFTDGEATSKDTYINTQIEKMSMTKCGNRKNTTENCGIELVKHLNTTDINTDMGGIQNIITHTIGFALDDEDGTDYLKEVAEAGGGNFYEASNAESILSAFRDIVSMVRTTATSFAAPTLSINAFNRLFHNSEVYFALFAPSEFGLWDGNIKKYKLCADPKTCALGSVLDKNGEAAIGENDKIKETAHDLWNATDVADGSIIKAGGAGDSIPVPSQRKMYTNTRPSSSSPILNESLVSLSNVLPLPPTDNAAISNSRLGVVGTDERKKLFNWIYGYKNGEAKVDNLRDWRFGDPLHSSPGSITYGKNKTRVFSAGNDGIIRSLDGETGDELWAFIPYEMLSLQKPLMDGTKYPPKAYGVDGTPSFLVRDGNGNGVVDNGEKVKLFIGTRRGGRYIYGLDVTSDEPTLLWTIVGGKTNGYTKLGQTWSTPKPTIIRVDGTEKVVLIYGGGYDDAYDLRQSYPKVATIDGREFERTGNAIFITDAETGELIWWVGNKGSGASMELSNMIYPIPSDVTVYDSNGDGITDRLYVGDLGGQVWRIDLGGDIGPSSRGNSLGGRLAHIANEADPQHHRHFYYAPDIVQLQDEEYSLEANYDLILITTGFRANPIGNYIKDRFYAIRDRAINGLIPKSSNSGNLGDAKLDTPEDMPTGEDADDSKFFTLEHGTQNGGSSTYEAFYDATDNVLQVGNDAMRNEAKVLLQTKHGLFIDLVDKGEKGLSSPIVLDGKVFFTTFVPPGSVNTGAGGPGEGAGEDTFDEKDVTDPSSDFNSATGGGRFPDANGNCTNKALANKLCHYPPGNQQNFQVICVGKSSLKSHYDHHEDVDFDETLGTCPSFTEASMANACTNDVPEGSGKLYSLDVLTGGAASNFNPDNDKDDGKDDDSADDSGTTPGDGTDTGEGDDDSGTKDASDRAEQLGDGIPSNALPVFLPEGITVVVGTGGGLHRLDETLDIPKQQVYWLEE